MTWYPNANRRPIANHGGTMSAHLGLILHVQVGNSDLGGQFNDRASQSSYTWVAYKDGSLDEFVDADQVAWGQGAGNATYNSVGSQGFPNEPLTELACQTIAALYQWGHDTYGWPYQLADSPGQKGFGWHGMGGKAWGSHPNCPGELRRAQRQYILDLARRTDPLPPSSTVPPFPGRLIRQGMSGPDVKTWQAQMATRGWAIGADGIYDKKSEGVCRQFQAEKGLGVDGIIGPATWRAAWAAPVT